MPDATTVYDLPYPLGGEGANGPGAFKALAEGVEAALVDLQLSDQKVLSASASPTSTSNVAMASLDMSVVVSGTDDVFWVTLSAEVLIDVASTVNIIECLIDGAAEGVQLRTAGPLNMRSSGSKRWRITGLAEGAHAITFRTRNTAGSTGATVVGTMTSASYSR